MVHLLDYYNNVLKLTNFIHQEAPIKLSET